jgi:hypothetical protein
MSPPAQTCAKTVYRLTSAADPAVAGTSKHRFSARLRAGFAKDAGHVVFNAALRHTESQSNLFA